MVKVTHGKRKGNSMALFINDKYIGLIYTEPDCWKKRYSLTINPHRARNYKTEEAALAGAQRIVDDIEAGKLENFYIKQILKKKKEEERK